MDVDAAAEALARGDVVVIPTDTVYGVAVDPFVGGATRRLFDAKRRPRDVTLPVLIGDPADVTKVAIVTPFAQRLIDQYWPGALTIVLPRRDDVSFDLGTNEATVGVRCPDHAVVRELCSRVGPLAVTSANLHGQPTPATADEVARELGAAVSVVIDGGPCAGEPSTVVDCTRDEPLVLRQGALVVS